MREGLYVHVDEVKKVLDTFGSKSGTGMTIINDDFVLNQCKEKAELYVTPKGNLIRKTQ